LSDSFTNVHFFLNRELLSNALTSQDQSLSYETSSIVRVAARTKMLANVAHAATGYSAIQKVYRTQFDEARSNVRIRDFSMSYQPLYRLSEKKFNFTTLLKKNTDSNYQPVFLKAQPHGPLSNLYAFQSFHSTQTFDFPFRLAIKSDPARYL